VPWLARRLARRLLSLLLTVWEGARWEARDLLVCPSLALLTRLGHVRHLHQQLWGELPSKPIEQCSSYLVIGLVSCAHAGVGVG